MAVSGLVGGAGVETTVYPFITRNVSVLGIDSVEAPATLRDDVWAQLDGALARGRSTRWSTARSVWTGSPAASRADAGGRARPDTRGPDR